MALGEVIQSRCNELQKLSTKNLSLAGFAGLQACKLPDNIGRSYYRIKSDVADISFRDEATGKLSAAKILGATAGIGSVLGMARLGGPGRTATIFGDRQPVDPRKLADARRAVEAIRYHLLSDRTFLGETGWSKNQATLLLQALENALNNKSKLPDDHFTNTAIFVENQLLRLLDKAGSYPVMHEASTKTFAPRGMVSMEGLKVPLFNHIEAIRSFLRSRLPNLGCGVSF